MKRLSVLVLLIGAVAMVSTCGRIGGGKKDRDRLTFDGAEFKMSSRTIDKKNLARFSVEVRPVSASLDGAREAGRYEGTRYCIENYGTSRINWEIGPETEAETLVIEKDRLTFVGVCNP